MFSHLIKPHPYRKPGPARRPLHPAAAALLGGMAGAILATALANLTT